MKRIILCLLIGISIYGNAQVTESSFFSLNQVAGDYSKIRAKSETEIVSTSFSIYDGIEMFTFIKDANTMVYATVPYGYRINDFVIMDNCIFFCGQNILDSCGYIGIFDVNVSTMNIGGYRFVNIPNTVELTKIIAYNTSESLEKYGVVTIGIPQNNGFKSCVVDLNNYSNNNNLWMYTIGMTANEYITDIALMSDDYGNGEIVSVGQSILSNANTSDVPILYTKKMYIRNYKKIAVLSSGMENEINSYSYNGIRLSPDSSFRMHNLGNNRVAVLTVAQYSNLQGSNLTYGIESKIIDLYSMAIQKVQFINNTPGTLKEMTYFSNDDKLAVLKKHTQNVDEIFIFDLSKNSYYSSSKLYCNNSSLNSIVCYNDDYFLVTGLEHNLINSRLSLLQENVNKFSTSECVENSNINISSDNVSLYPNFVGTNAFSTQIHIA